MRRTLLVLCFALAACREAPPPAPVATMPEPAPAATSAIPTGDVAEGLRVATRVGCNGCHGRDAAGQVFMENEEAGRLVAPNLTERRDLYDDAALAALLHEGKTHDGHVPWGMPIQMFQHLSHREVRDIAAWLRSLVPVPNPDLPESAWSDALVAATVDGTHPWLEDLRPSPGNQPPAVPPTEPLALGKHLAMTSCTECHGWDLNGFEGDTTPSLVVAKAYTPDQFMQLMRTGEVATGGKSATGLMSAMAEWRFNAMTDEEITALKAYLDAR
jgi:mono/diheme cytochrome c family protein